MSSRVIVAVTLKPFWDSKWRLDGVLSPDVRAGLSEELALRTIECVDAAGGDPLAVVCDETTGRWAERLGVPTLSDLGAGLDVAATLAVSAAMAQDRPWAVCHADLPVLRHEDLEAALGPIRDGRPALAPSSDGGTTLVGWHRPLRFAYGPASFHRHLSRLRRFDPAVVVRRGLLLDLDGPSDLSAARSIAEGGWLTDVIEPSRVAS